MDKTLESASAPKEQFRKRERISQVNNRAEGICFLLFLFMQEVLTEFKFNIIG